MDDIEIRPATQADVAEFFPKLDSTVYAWSVFHKGGLVCVSGIAITPTLMLAFSQIKPDLEVSNLTVWRCTKIIWDKMKAMNFNRLYAIADPALWSAPQFLSKLGFKHIESSVRGEIYLWEIP